LHNFWVNVLAKNKSQQTILHYVAAFRSQCMLDFLADKTAERVAMVDVESKDIGNMTARERLHELEPTAELLAAFTRLVRTRPGDLESPGSCCELAPGSL
jgi:hypothetical protein